MYTRFDAWIADGPAKDVWDPILTPRTHRDVNFTKIDGKLLICVARASMLFQGTCLEPAVPPQSVRWG